MATTSRFAATGSLIYPVSTHVWCHTPEILKRLTVAHHTHTWWYSNNRSPLWTLSTQNNRLQARDQPGGGWSGGRGEPHQLRGLVCLQVGVEPPYEGHAVLGLPLEEPVVVEPLHELILPLHRHARADLVEPEETPVNSHYSQQDLFYFVWSNWRQTETLTELVPVLPCGFQ